MSGLKFRVWTIVDTVQYPIRSEAFRPFLNSQVICRAREAEEMFWKFSIHRQKKINLVLMVLGTI